MSKILTMNGALGMPLGFFSSVKIGTTLAAIGVQRNSEDGDLSNSKSGR